LFLSVFLVLIFIIGMITGDLKTVNFIGCDISTNVGM
jgi:hypothetical protein